MPISTTLQNINIHPGYTPGEYYFAGNFWGVPTNGTAVLTNSSIRYHPVTFNEDVTIDRLAIDVPVGVASSQAKIAIFRPSASVKGKPGNLLVETGFLDCSTAGVKAGIIADTFLKAGVYYIATLGGNTSPNIRLCNNSIYSNLIGDAGTSDFTNFWSSYIQVGSFTGFPANASGLGRNRVVPVIKFRVKP